MITTLSFSKGGKGGLVRDGIEALDRTVIMCLDYTEVQAQCRSTPTRRDWEDTLDVFPQFNEREVLTHAGNLRAEVAEKMALERYEQFDAARREAERLAADDADIAELEGVEKAAKEGRKNGGIDA